MEVFNFFGSQRGNDRVTNYKAGLNGRNVEVQYLCAWLYFQLRILDRRGDKRGKLVKLDLNVQKAINNLNLEL